MKKLKPCIKMGRKNRKLDDAEIEEHEFRESIFLFFELGLKNALGSCICKTFHRRCLTVF